MLLLLLSCWIITGVMAGSPSTTHHALKNSSVCLRVQKSPPYTSATWKFAETLIVAGKINPDYEKRVVYSPENLSLCINQLNDKDTGIYEVLIHANFKAISEKHEVIVEEMVPVPVISISVLLSNHSAGFCKITGNCSIQDDRLSFVCEEGSCRKTQMSFSKVNITVYTNNTSVICSANNNVSINNASESIAMCYNESKSKPGEKVPQSLKTELIIGVGCVVLLLLIICAGILAKNHTSSACCHSRPRPHAAQVIQSQPMGAPPRSEPRVSTSSSSQAEASYENVDITQPNQTSSPREELGSRQSHEVNTTYSVVQRPKAATRLGKSDNSNNTKGHENIQDALASESVNLDEAQRSMQVDTVYTVLQNPKNLKPQHHQ